MSNNAARFSNRKAKKVVGESSHQPKVKFVEERQSRAQQHIQTLTQKQDDMLRAIENNVLALCIGASGTGKTYIACRQAAKMLLSGEIKKIVITRPYVALANRTTGFKPSTDLEKLRGFILPMLHYLGEVLGRGMVEEHIQSQDGKIELAPLESLRGRSFDNTFLIVDEVQNTVPDEINALVTRIGVNSKIVLCGDPVQKDTTESKCGALYLERLINKHKIDDCAIIKFDSSHVVRSGICKAFVIAIDKEIVEGVNHK